MRTIKKHQGLIYTAILSVILMACGNDATKPAGTNEVKPAETTSTPQPGNKKTENAIVRFKVNGMDANTGMGIGNDNSKQLGIVNGTNNHLSFVLNGDDPKFPFRGALSMSLDNFDFKAGEYKCNASFSRYQRPNAAGEIQYDSQRGGNFSVNFSSITRSTDANMVGEMYEATGTFSGKLGLKMGYEKDSDVKTIDITDGYFEKVPIQVYGKK